MPYAPRASDRAALRLKLRDLHVLMAVVQTGSMRKAASHLNTTQPSISRSIAELEAAVGVRLLERNQQGVEPTKYGRALLDGGVAMFDDLRQAMKNIEFLSDPTTGEVRIACNASLATSFLSAVLERMSRRYPGIDFKVVLREAELLHRELTERKVDLLVTRRLGDFADERLNFESLFNDPYVVVAGAQNPWVRRRRIELRELVNEPWTLSPPENVLGVVAREIFRASGLDYPRVAVAAAAPEMRISLLASGRFLSIFPNSILRFPTGRPELRILPVQVRVPPAPVGIAILKNRTLSPVARLFIEHARDVAKAPATKTR